MKVAVIPTIRDYPWGAPGECMGELVRSLFEAGHQVLWMVAKIDADNPQVAALAVQGVQVKVLPDLRPSFVRLAAVRGALDRLIHGGASLATELAAFNPEHVFLNQGGTWCGLQNEFYFPLQACSGRYSLIAHLNQPRPAFSELQLQRARKLVEGARRFFFNSEWTRSLAECQLARSIPQARLFQLPLRFRFENVVPWPANRIPVVAMVNRLDAYHKGIDLALGAVAELKRHGTMLHLRIYGRGQDERYLRELADHLGVASMVDFLGYTEDLEKIWADAEMLLLPSRFEGLAVSMLEAMGFGRVVLRTPHGGAAEWVEDGITGYICPAAEIDALCQTLQRALAERPRWCEMGLRAHEKLRKNRDPNPAAVFLEALLNPSI